MNGDPTRSELLKAIADLGDLHSDCRLGQLLWNLAMFAGRIDAGGVWDLEDSEALAAAQRMVRSQREQLAPNA
ncbi:MAG TPA: hypothetical protein VGY55_11295 [Pirellulales bacterium]|jgi:hypothetical protein|nr:hypothetical protein [Pirellulales bacterium]